MRACAIFWRMNPITLSEVFQLPAAERVRIASALWDSVADQPQALELTPEQAQELDVRYADYLANPHGGLSWAEALLVIRPSR